MNVRGNCRFCYKISELVCARCGGDYCSPKCQIQDWQSHRYVCLPMPKLATYESYKKRQSEHSFYDEKIPKLKSELKDDYDSDKKRKQFQNYQKQPAVLDSTQVSSTFENRESNSFQFSFNDRIILVNFYSTNRCYIRSALPKDKLEYNDIIKKINEEGQNAKPLEQQPKMFSYVITHLYNPNGIMARAKIIHLGHDNNYRVEFYDFGAAAFRNFSDLKSIPENLKCLPECTRLVHLLRVPYSKITAHRDFLNFKNKEYKITFCMAPRQIFDIELECVETGDILNHTLKEYFHRTLENYNVDADNKNKSSKRNQTSLNDRQLSLAQTPPFQTCLPKRKKNVNILVLNDSLLQNGKFGAILQNDLRTLNGIQNYLKNFNPMVKSYKPTVDEYVIAKFNGNWYRAKVMEEQSNKIDYTLKFIDLPNENIVSFEDIRRYPNYFKSDCKSFVCLINGLPEELNDDQKKYLLSEIHLHKKLTVNVLEKIDNTILLIEIPGFINKINSYKKVSTN